LCMSIQDNAIHFPEVITQLHTSDPTLAVEVQHHWDHLHSVNAFHLSCCDNHIDSSLQMVIFTILLLLLLSLGYVRIFTAYIIVFPLPRTLQSLLSFPLSPVLGCSLFTWVI
ncbi:uncharacterized protein BJ212DRAFT_1263334, partial [Suillus subaureus]